jgi:hypothetical protein
VLRPAVRRLRHLGQPGPAQVRRALLLRRPAAVGGPRRQRAHLPVRERCAGAVRPAAGQPGRRGRRIPRGHRRLHVVRRPVRRQRRRIPGGDRAAAGAVRAADRRAAGRADRPPGVHLGRVAGAGPLQRPQLGLPRHRDGRRCCLRLVAGQARPGRDAAGPGCGDQDLPRLLRAAAAAGPAAGPGPAGRGQGRGRHGRGVAGAQPAVPAGQPGRLVGHVRVPGRPGRRPDDQLDLVLGPARPRAVHCGPLVVRADRRGLGGGDRSRLGDRPAHRQLPVAAGQRGDAVLVPAVQQGLLAAVRALAGAVLRAAARPLGLVGVLRGGRPVALRRPVPVVLGHHAGRRLRPGQAGRRARRVGQGGAAGPALRGVPALLVVGQDPR